MIELKGLIDEDIANYKKCSMYLAFPSCTFKCDKENQCNVCQNSSLIKTPSINISPEDICERYINNPLSKAIICAGLEPFDSKYGLLSFIDCLRRQYNCNDEIIIYTGYTEQELTDTNNTSLYTIYENVLNYSNIIIKFGRFIPNEESHLDEILGIKLASSNQYAKKVS